MKAKRKALPGASPQGLKQNCADRVNDRAQLQSAKSPLETQEIEAFLAAVKRLRESLVDLVGAFYFEHLIKEVRR